MKTFISIHLNAFGNTAHSNLNQNIKMYPGRKWWTNIQLHKIVNMKQTHFELHLVKPGRVFPGFTNTNVLSNLLMDNIKLPVFVFSSDRPPEAPAGSSSHIQSQNRLNQYPGWCAAWGDAVSAHFLLLLSFVVCVYFNIINTNVSHEFMADFFTLDRLLNMKSTQTRECKQQERKLRKEGWKDRQEKVMTKGGK